MTWAELVADDCRKYGQIIRDFECKMLGNFYRCTKYSLDGYVWTIYMINGEVIKAKRIESNGDTVTIWN